VDKLYCCNASSNSKAFVYLSHLVAEIGAFFIVFSLHVIEYVVVTDVG
jgi:hypothetical protein